MNKSEKWNKVYIREKRLKSETTSDMGEKERNQFQNKGLRHQKKYENTSENGIKLKTVKDSNKLECKAIV